MVKKPSEDKKGVRPAHRASRSPEGAAAKSRRRRHSKGSTIGIGELLLTALLSVFTPYVIPLTKTERIQKRIADRNKRKSNS
jgi:hypothetical protein